jgi:subtilase family serine protease
VPRGFRILVAASSLVLSLLAVACGGGGGGSAVQPTPEVRNPTPTPSISSCASLKSSIARSALIVRPSWRAAIPARIGPGPAERVCPYGGPGHMRCLAWLRTDVTHESTPFGYGPTDLQSAYDLASASASDGAGQIVAVVDAYDDPNAESDLATYRQTFALAACTTTNGCFLKVNESGNTSPLPGTDSTGGWEAEESLDVDMVSAVCPNCKIVLVEASTDNNSDLYTAEDTAVSTCGAGEISNSWNGSEYSGETGDEVYFDHPGVMITVASGDMGYDNPNEGYPATSQFVTAVGGTTLTNNGISWTETVWNDGVVDGTLSATGSRCSQYIAQPSWQKNLGSAYTNVCGKRIDNDVAAVADPDTGVATFDSFGGKMGCLSWCVSGGTSVATPIIAAVYALAGNGASLTYGSYSYSNQSFLRDITTGSNGSCGGTYLCNAETGYDGPTGNGSPQGIGAF